MENSIISEGKTTNEAIENGLRKLNVSKNKVNIKVLENEEKRSFFSILTPRVVRVQLTLKDVKPEKVVIELTEEEQNIAEKNIKSFLDDFLKNIDENADVKINTSKDGINVNINSEKCGFLIGYRGDTLYAMQSIISAVANKGVKDKVRVILDIENYKEKRKKTLEDLADKIAATVVKTKKSVTLEPMNAYERKIIHTKLQDSEKVETRSIGEEPRRKVVIELKRK